LYLPVPTISRERNVLPATVHVSASGRVIAAADEMHDLQLVAILDQHGIQRRARHDLQIALDRDLRRIEAKLPRQARKRQPRRHPAMLAVDADRKSAVCAHENVAWICASGRPRI
jgi:hypothetical protein